MNKQKKWIIAGVVIIVIIIAFIVTESKVLKFNLEKGQSDSTTVNQVK
jgi:uncharacterized integral membrane protein